MADKSLLILITRMTGKDEWSQLWNFPPETFMAFVRKGEVALLPYSDLAQLDPNGHLDYDLWLFHGLEVVGGKRMRLYQTLNRVDWEKESAGRKVALKVHRGGGEPIDWGKLLAGSEELVNTQWLLRRAERYSLGDKLEPSDPMVRLAEAVKAGQWDKFHQRLQEQETLPLPVKVSGIKHSLINVLKPIDVDFDGLREANLQHWGEIAEKYKNGAARAKLGKARALLYGSGGEAETLEQVLKTAGERYREDAAAREWETVKRTLPAADPVVHKGTDITLMLERLENPANREAFEEYLRDGKCAFRDWLVELDEALTAVRRALAAKDA